MSSLRVTYADLRKLMAAIKNYGNDDRLMKEKLNELDNDIIIQRQRKKFATPPALFITQSVSVKVDYECNYDSIGDGANCMKMKRSKFEELKRKHTPFNYK